MDISNLKNLSVRTHLDSDSLASVVAKAHSGNTVLFIGAGFSLGCENELDESMPLAKDLSKKICMLGGFEEDEDLAYSADYYIKYNDPNALVGLLKKCFGIKEVRKYHENIAQIDWRRVYTTNYDNCFELASGKVGKHILPLTLEANPTTYFRRRDVCVHINGAIQLLDTTSLEDSFKLSESSYTNSDAFSDSSWLYRFKKDLDICSQIVFVGYSLYDMEVKRLLVKNEDLKNKTFFVTRKDISQKEHHRLSAFGEVFPIGVQTFGEMLSQEKPSQLPSGLEYFTSLQRETVSYDADFVDADIRDFLLRGKLDLNSIAASLTARDKLYAIERKQVSDAINIFGTSNAIVLHGSIANGKTVAANQIVAKLLLEGEVVFSVRDDEASYEEDIDKLSEINRRAFLLVDDFEKNLDIIRYFSSSLGDKGFLILTERPHRYRRSMVSLKGIGLNPHALNIDYLHDNETKEVARLLSNTGLWGIRAGDSYEKQIRYLTKECGSQISVILLDLLKSPQITKRFEDSFEAILKYPNTKKTVHSICLIQYIYPTKCNKSYISDISDSTHVYSQEFDERVLESGLFEFRQNTLLTRSSIFSTFILSRLYKAAYTIDQLVRIAQKLQRIRGQQSYEEREMFRSIMTFGTLSSILPPENRSNSYIQFYEKMKREVPAVIGNPHYWLQYAMAVMSENNLADAERILDTAYAKANNNPDYDTTYIDNQFARLRLKQAIREVNQKASVEYFLNAHKILRKEENDIYKFRQAELYIAYYDERYSHLSKGDKVKYEHAVKEILSHYEAFLDTEYPFGDVPPFQVEQIDEFRAVVEKINRESTA